MPLLKNGKFSEDTWTYLDDDANLPADGAVIVSLEQWLANKVSAEGRNAPLGIVLRPGQSPEEIKDDLDRFQMVALEFLAYKDGRAYSYARLLRERYGYAGEVRAVGQVLRDQLLYLQRVGFDALEVDERISEADFASELSKFSARYQPSSDTSDTVLRRRHHNTAPAAAE
jgi:uncharacterized protein (DUF934 family)